MVVLIPEVLVCLITFPVGGALNVFYCLVCLYGSEEL